MSRLGCGRCEGTALGGEIMRGLDRGHPPAVAGQALGGSTSLEAMAADTKVAAV